MRSVLDGTDWTEAELEQAAGAAVRGEGLRLAYQPIVSVQTGAAVGYEGLLRWTDPRRGLAPTERLIAAAERCGLIVPLGRLVLERACREAAAWRHAARIAVNVSPLQFVGDDLVGAVQSCLVQSGLPPERLELEITEGVLLADSAPVLEAMRALRRHGVGLVLDDFGTAYAGLSALTRFPFSGLKIDSSFVRDLGRDRACDAVVEAILLLGRRLDLRVVAEGVETAEQFERLRGLGCGFVQGCFLGSPGPGDAV